MVKTKKSAINKCKRIFILVLLKNAEKMTLKAENSDSGEVSKRVSLLPKSRAEQLNLKQANS
jgi:hypothetical protein